MTPLLNNLYVKYGVDQLSHGAVTDALGDVYEEFVESIFKNLVTLQSWPANTLEYCIADQLLRYLQLNISQISAISSSRVGIPPTVRGGSPKTDVYLNILLVNQQQLLVPLNVKQSTVAKVSFAEYDVDTIVQALGIQDPQLIALLLKHQVDASAKNFTANERRYLRENLEPYARNLVRWCITLNANPILKDIRYPEYVIRFDLHHPKNNNPLGNQYKDFNVYDIDSYINKIMQNSRGVPRTGGFGTGLSWTYATGSKGSKIQFKA